MSLSTKSSIQTVVIIYNPLSGRGRAARVSQQACIELENFGWQVSRVIPTEYAGHAETQLTPEWCSKVDLIVIIGGDGTLREVVTGLIRANSITCIGFIPMGNANVVAREVGIPLNSDQAIKNLMAGTVISLDVGKFEFGIQSEQYFLAMIEIGQGAKIVHHVDRLRKGRLRRLYQFWGDIIYLIGGLLSFFGRKPAPFTLKMDDSYASPNLRQAVVSCIRNYSKGWSMTPAAVFDDGLLDLVSSKSASILTFGRHMISASACKPFNAPFIYYGKGKSFDIESKSLLYVQVDGEAMTRTTRLSVETVAAAYRILTTSRT